MNGNEAAHLVKTPAQLQNQQQAVQFCQAILKRAQEGRIDSIFVVMVSPLDEITPCGVGAKLADINVGLDMGKDLVMQTLRRPGPQILRSGG